MLKTNENNKLSYDGNDNGNYDLLLNGKYIAEIFLGEDNAIWIVAIMNKFLSENFDDKNEIIINNDNENLGIIIDIYQNDHTQLINTCTFWFEDFCNFL